MKTAILVLACVFQNVFRSVSCSSFAHKYENGGKMTIGTPTGVHDFNPSDPSVPLGEVEDSKATGLVSIGPFSPVIFDTNIRGTSTAHSDRYLDTTGNITPVNVLISSSRRENPRMGGTPFIHRNFRSNPVDLDVSDEDSEIIELISGLNIGRESEVTPVVVNPVRYSPSVTVEDAESDDDLELHRLNVTGKVHRPEDFEGDELMDFIHTTDPEEEREEERLEDEIILSNYRNASHICSLSQSRRSQLHFHLNNQILNSGSLKSPMKLSEIPPILFRLKITYLIHQILDILHLKKYKFDPLEMKSDEFLKLRISECEKVMKIDHWVLMIEYLYRANLTAMADEYLEQHILQFLERFNLEQQIIFLSNLSTYGHFRVALGLLNDPRFSQPIGKALCSFDIFFILQNFLNYDGISEQECAAVQKLLLAGKYSKEFLKKYGANLTKIIHRKRK